MDHLEQLFDNNARWVKDRLADDPDYYARRAGSQSPRYLWVGCSDSRVPANIVVGLEAGDLFVHRNVANLFPHGDLNSLSVLEFAVNYLRVEHVIVCGHYGCGGVEAAMQRQQFGIVDHWLLNIRDVYAQHQKELDAIEDETLRGQRVVELNVQQQVRNISRTTVVQNAWTAKHNLGIHGWVYDIHTGLLKDLACSRQDMSDVGPAYHTS